MELNYCLTVAALKVLSAFFGYRCLREAPLLCMEALDSFDRRMSGHWYAAVLRHLGADDGVGGGGSCSSGSQEHDNEQQIPAPSDVWRS